jgi:adenylate cyclase, class 2
MKGFNVEIKARCDDPGRVRKILAANGAVFKGVDRQIDTYFNVGRGRLKLRRGNIENCLVFYEREDRKGPKRSKIDLFPADARTAALLLPVLTAALGVKRIVEKRREIGFIDNVKFHLDRVKGLGAFVEFEAMDDGGRIGKRKLLEQCRFYLRLLDIPENDLEARSYADMIAGLGRSGAGPSRRLTGKGIGR